MPSSDRSPAGGERPVPFFATEPRLHHYSFCWYSTGNWTAAAALPRGPTFARTRLFCLTDMWPWTWRHCPVTQQQLKSVFRHRWLRWRALHVQLQTNQSYLYLEVSFSLRYLCYFRRWANAVVWRRRLKVSFTLASILYKSPAKMKSCWQAVLKTSFWKHVILPNRLRLLQYYWKENFLFF